jgi:hypothetical protein
MKFITGPRACGKTVKLIMAANECNGVVLVAKHTQADYVRGLARDLGCSNLEVRTHSEALAKALRGGRPIFIDNLQRFLHASVGDCGNIIAAVIDGGESTFDITVPTLGDAEEQTLNITYDPRP